MASNVEDTCSLAADGMAITRPTASLADWSQDIERAFGPMRLSARHRTNFLGSFAPVSAAGLQLATVSGNIVAIEQPRVSDTPDSCDWFLVTSLHGRTTIAHDAREVAFDVGDFVLVNEADDRRMRFDGPFHHLSIRLPARFVGDHLTIDRLDAPQFTPATSALSRALLPLLKVVAEESCTSEDELSGLRDAAYDLMGGMLRALTKSAPPIHLIGPRARQLTRARAAIAQHITDPSLSAEQIASLAAVSLRTLHRLFAEAGTSVGATIREVRLQRFRADLVSPRWRDESTTALALRAGYNDPAHASRAFRSRFRTTPTAYRAVN